MCEIALVGLRPAQKKKKKKKRGQRSPKRCRQKSGRGRVATLAVGGHAILRSSAQLKKYLRMMQPQQEAANCDPDKDNSCQKQSKVANSEEGGILSGGGPHVVRTLLTDKSILHYAITISPSAHELNNEVKNETSPSHFHHPIRHLLAFLAQLRHKYMSQKAVTVNRGQEYQTLITVRPSEHWCKMQRISLNGF